MTMRVLIMYDAHGWAQHRHAIGLQKHAGPEFDVTIGLLSHEYDFAAYDAIYNIYFAAVRPVPGARSVTCLASHAWMHSSNDPTDWRTRGVNPRRNAENGIICASRADAVICRNEALEAWVKPYARETATIPAGVDTDVFHAVGRVENTSRRLRVGWCGQVSGRPGADFKGYAEVWRPLVASLSERYEFREFSHAADKALSATHMADWYRSLDVFVSTASAEGTPNPPFEAAACGCVVISTDVGQVTDWKELRYQRLVVPTYRNPAEASFTREMITGNLRALESHVMRQEPMLRLLDSIQRHYSYRVIAPETLKFISGVK